jgi:predicted aspartyl protease
MKSNPFALRRFRAVACVWAAFSLAIPAGAESDPTPEAVLATLPFLGDEINRIFIDLAPEGSSRSFRMMLDTGASFSVLTPGAAREIGVKVRRIKRDPYRRKTLLGRDLQFYIDVRSSDTGSRTGWDYGLLGGNFLAEYVVEFDFPGRRVRFLDPKKYAVPKEVDAPDEAVLPLLIVSNRPGVKIQTNGVDHTVLLDTGAPLPLILSGPEAAKSAIESRPIAGSATAGVFGEMETELGEAETVQLGPFLFENVPVDVAPKGWFNMGFPGDSVLGYDLLAQFVVRIDFRRGRMWLRRNPNASVTWLGQEWAEIKAVGAHLEPLREKEGFRVGMVLPSGAAERRGLSPGDYVESSKTLSELMLAIAKGDLLEVIRRIDGVDQRVELPGATPGADESLPVGPDASAQHD